MTRESGFVCAAEQAPVAPKRLIPSPVSAADILANAAHPQ